MENVKIIGIEKVHYTKRDGTVVDGYSFFCEVLYKPSEKNMNLTGIKIKTIWVKPQVYDDMLTYFKVDNMVGLSGYFTYNQYGKPMGFMKQA